MRKGWSAAWCGVPAFGILERQSVPERGNSKFCLAVPPVCEISVKMWKKPKNSAKMGKRKKKHNKNQKGDDTYHGIVKDISSG